MFQNSQASQSALSSSSERFSLNDRAILLTGGTGSFGKAFTRNVCKNFTPKQLIIFSRDELKQFEMQQEFPESKFPFLKFVIGDVRDRNRLYRTMEGVDMVVHAAAMKQVPTSENNPTEAIKTNVLGAMNIIDAAVYCGVTKVVALSTDKACNPINLYGATKLCSDKLFIAANSSSSLRRPTVFSVVRYGNVVGSRGSVVPFFLKMRQTGTIPVTNENMTRFFITLQHGVELVLTALEHMHGGEIFVPKIPSMKIMDLAKLIGPDCKISVIGVRPGEKIHEALISLEEGRLTYEFPRHYIIAPDVPLWSGAQELFKVAKKTPEGFSYSSHTNTEWLTNEKMMSLISGLSQE